jgi:hypothetical protein
VTDNVDRKVALEGALSFILAEFILIFYYLLVLTASICFAPLAIMLLGWFWLYGHPDEKEGDFQPEIGMLSALALDPPTGGFLPCWWYLCYYLVDQ